jgi:hypothetical protein
MHLKGAMRHHCHVAGLLASGKPIVPELATIFMLRCDRIPVRLTCLHQLSPWTDDWHNIFMLKKVPPVDEPRGHDLFEPTDMAG